MSVRVIRRKPRRQAVNVSTGKPRATDAGFRSAASDGVRVPDCTPEAHSASEENVGIFATEEAP